MLFIFYCSWIRNLVNRVFKEMPAVMRKWEMRGAQVSTVQMNAQVSAQENAQANAKVNTQADEHVATGSSTCKFFTCSFLRSTFWATKHFARWPAHGALVHVCAHLPIHLRTWSEPYLHFGFPVFWQSMFNFSLRGFESKIIRWLLTHTS